LQVLTWQRHMATGSVCNSLTILFTHCKGYVEWANMGETLCCAGRLSTEAHPECDACSYCHGVRGDLRSIGISMNDGQSADCCV
jgi:hypothetical protein